MIILALTVLLTIVALVLSSDRIGLAFKILCLAALGYVAMELAMMLTDTARWVDDTTEDRR